MDLLKTIWTEKSIADYSNDQSLLKPAINLCNDTWPSDSKTHRLIGNIKGWDRQIWRWNRVKEQ